MDCFSFPALPFLDARNAGYVRLSLGQANYDEFYKPGAYLRTHADHMAWWHGAEVHDAP
jgi:hypothetical protein